MYRNDIENVEDLGVHLLHDLSELEISHPVNFFDFDLRIALAVLELSK